MQALRFDPVPRSGGNTATPQRPAAAKGDANSSTTLGDLADRLEEALAQEVQAASKGDRAFDLESEDFSFDDKGSGRGTRLGRQAEQDTRPAKREAQQRPAPAPDAQHSPEPERRREPPASSERREEAPVISLNARRRESSDALEDEMARLLGELTGDTKGR